jgi:hypothetical protein
MMVAVSYASAVLSIAVGFVMVLEAIRRESARALLSQRRVLLGQRACGVFMAASGAAQYAAVSFGERHVLAEGVPPAIGAVVLLGVGAALRRLSRRVSGPDLPGWPLEGRLAGLLLLFIVLDAVVGRVWDGVAAAASILALGELIYWLHWQLDGRSGRRPCCRPPSAREHRLWP